VVSKTDGFLREINAGDGKLHAFLARIGQASKRRGAFVLCLGSTATSDVDGISAAGSTAAERRMTPAVDAEALVLGRPVSLPRLPTSPNGIVSPVVISRAALQLSNVPTKVVSCGTFWSPAAELSCTFTGNGPARCVSTGRAMSLHIVEQLFANGLALGKKLSQELDYAVVGECVPGGTTTAQALLLALGHKAHGLVSSSLPGGNHSLKSQLVSAGLAAALAGNSDLNSDPLRAAGAVGDPMQPFAAGFVLGAGKHIPVLLAGGTQMLAVFALMKAMPHYQSLPGETVAVATTKWVATDKSANPAQIARLLGAPMLASCPDFRKSRHAGLRAYEEGNVKEGIGAGGSMALAYMKGFSAREIQEAIDATYDTMVLNS
jgi:uncharacterized protein (TIGR00303 family)